MSYVEHVNINNRDKILLVMKIVIQVVVLFQKKLLKDKVKEKALKVKQQC